jgi:hypothetical protein
MAGEHFYLTRSSHDKLKRIVRLNQPLGGQPPRRNLISPGDPEIVRLGKLYGPVTAATFDGSKTLTQAKKCEVLLHRIRADGSTMEAFEDLPEVGYWIFEQDGDTGNEVVCLRDRSINDPANPNIAQPGWVVFPLKPSTAGDVPSIYLGIGASAAAINELTTDGSSKYINWSQSEEDNSDTSVFDHNFPNGVGIYRAIQCKVAGKYRVEYHIDTEADTTHNASQIVRASCEIVKVLGPTLADSIVPRSSRKVESLHIDNLDMPVGLGALNGGASVATQCDMAASDMFLVRLLLLSGEPRGIRVVGESFGAQLVKRA